MIHKFFSLNVLKLRVLLVTTSVGVFPGLLMAQESALSFPATKPTYVSQRQSAESILIQASVDNRAGHVGQYEAKAGWHACTKDVLSDGSLTKLIDERILEALTESKLFSETGINAANAQWILVPEIEAFCSQTKGFVFRRIAGFVAIKFTLKKSTDTMWSKTIEHFLTDADAEYTGSFVGTVNGAMKQSMADALRLVLRKALIEIADMATKNQ